MRFAALGLVPLLLLGICACQDGEATRLSLLQADRDFSAMSASRGFNAAVQNYAADDVVFMPEQSAPLKGKPAVLQSLATLPAGTRISWTPQAAETSTAGDLGYSWGTYELNGRNAAGQATLAYGNYLFTWKRRADAWQLQVMMTNPVPGPGG